MRIFEDKSVTKIKIVIMLIILCTIISPNIVEAKRTSSSESCKNALFSGDGIGISRGAMSYSVNINVLEGTWDLYYHIGDEDEDWSNVVKNGGGLKNVQHTVYRAGDPTPGSISNISRGKNNKEIFVFMALKEKSGNHGMNASGDLLKVGANNTTCVAGSESSFSLDDNSIEFKKKGGKNPTVIVRRFTVPAKLDKTAINKSSSGECNLMKSGKYNSNGNDSTYDVDDSHLNEYNNIMSQSFSYCYGGVYSSFDVEDSTIRAVRKKSLKAFKEYINFKEAQKDNGKFDEATNEIRTGGYQKVTLQNKKAIIDTLSCDKKADKETTKKYYAESVVEDNSICRVTCQEQFQVTYDPPVAVKAGLCFQYKVTVRSKVTCKTEDKGGIKWPTPPETCGYTPICEDNAYETQAGPNEDFDSCISACDGGKYSQKCINSCYKEIYEENSKSNTTKTANISTIEDNSTKKLAKSSKDPYYQDSRCNSNSTIRNNLDHCGNFFYKVKQKYPMGYYANSSDEDEKWIDYRWKICWNTSSKKCTYYDDDDNKLSLTVDRWNNSNPSGSGPAGSVVEHIKRSSPYYLRTSAEATRLIKSFYGIDSGLNGYGARRYYQIDNRGIKRQWSTTYRCHETCGYVSDGGNAGSCLTSSKEIQDYYTDELEAIETKLAKCTTNATCKEDTATFYIDVTDKKTYSDKEKEAWNATNKSSSESSTPQTGGDNSMFIQLECTDAQRQATPLVCDVESVESAPGINGICYGRDNPKYWQHYKTTITFPGTWINLKSAERVYKEPNSSSLNNYREKKNYYCTGYDSEDVNVDWWNWKVNGKGNVNSITLEKDNNITANISDFGKFDWGVGLKCFFGLYTKICDPESGDPDCNFPEEEDQCSGENSTAICNYKFRVIDQANMFPDEQGLKGNRERGFNWTTKAIDNTIPTSSSYFIDPEKYWQQLEASADTAFPRTDAEFSNSDYRVKLSRDNIKNIKSYVKKNNFNTFDGTYRKVTPEVEGLYYYRSGLRNNTSLVSSWTGDVAGKNNN